MRLSVSSAECSRWYGEGFVILATASAGHALDLGSEAPPLLVVDKGSGCVCLPRVGHLDWKGGACSPAPRSHRDRKMVKRRAQITKALTDDDRDHRVGFLGHLQAVEPDMPQGFRLPDPLGPVRVPARISSHRLLDFVEMAAPPVRP